MPDCPICGTTTSDPKVALDFAGYDCIRCGRWSVRMQSSSVDEHLRRILGEWDPRALRRRSRISYQLRRKQSQLPSSSRWIELTLPDVEYVIANDEALPSPSEQLDSLILLVGENQPSPGQSAELNASATSAWIGSTITTPPGNSGLGWLLEQSATRELVENRALPSAVLLLRLTMLGWARLDELKRRHVESRRVLMAMKFGDAELDEVVLKCFVPAVERTGFQLRRAIDEQPAGLIDDQIRVALRTSKFVIADLTHGSNGAYWEAGFAEGLGRPVIYTCKESVWKNSSSHFDTNHLTTILWDPVDLQNVESRLIATIRATLPGEAIITD